MAADRNARRNHSARGALDSLGWPGVGGCTGVHDERRTAKHRIGRRAARREVRSREPAQGQRRAHRRTGIYRSAARRSRRITPTLGLASPGPLPSRIALDYQGPWISDPRVRKTAVSARNQRQACHWGREWSGRSTDSSESLLNRRRKARSQTCGRSRLARCWQLGARTQIDVWVNRRVSGGPDNWFIGGGVARRLR